MLRQAALAESLGYDALWAHEHHSEGMMYPSPLMTVAVLASVTKQIGLGTNMLLPLLHPLRVAEDGAMVDVMSDGRLKLGVSGGYSPFTSCRTTLRNKPHSTSSATASCGFMIPGATRT
jgi:alkanesulfonate monooxygenase SsuD/methylene tetrahydromethanopterin reductase-like flavin-dependent oxidoreductase (luciferase family)